MPLARAFTTRRTKPQISSPMPQRSLTTRQFAAGKINRSKISSPVELISTTNMLSYNAPDIYPSSNSSQSGDDDVDSLPPLTHSPVTSPDNSSAGSAPGSPEPNHLSCYFGGSGQRSPPSPEDAPVLPQRALSHTKKTHEILSRKRSLSRASDASSKRGATSFARDSIQMFSSTIAEDAGPEPHPFGNELAQVTELAEEFGIRGNLTVIDEEEQYLINRGLFKFDAADYMSEIESYFTAAFRDPAPMRTMWI